ncbi:tryptophan-rich sensory protein [Candidatus Uhrbacteria bacterium]|nr:tryptophan-rich sensory protein [Candidatus Uhrbacteria bacterium]
MNTRIKLALSIIVPNAVGFFSSFAVSGALVEWYPSLIKPWFMPPNWLFAPVWVILYTLMGCAVFFIWREDIQKRLAAYALSAFVVQLALNGAWSMLFFGYHAIALALVDILLLWVSIIIMAVLFWRIKRTAAFLLAPYIIWVSFAVVLNWSILALN